MFFGKEDGQGVAIEVEVSVRRVEDHEGEEEDQDSETRLVEEVHDGRKAIVGDCLLEIISFFFSPTRFPVALFRRHCVVAGHH